MVGGLVEEQYVWVAKENLRQFNSHSPSAGEFLCRTVEVAAFKTESCQCSLHLGFVVVAAEKHIPLVLFSEPLHEGIVVITLVVGALGHLLLHLLQTVLHGNGACESLACFLSDSCLVSNLHHLRQIANSEVGGNRDAAACRLLDAAKQFEHCRLSGAIFTYESNAVVVVDNERDIAEKWLGSKLNG